MPRSYLHASLLILASGLAMACSPRDDDARAAQPADTAQAAAQPAAEPAEARMVIGDSLTWTDANVPGFNPGMMIAVVHGDPSKAEPYTLRLKFPDGYRFPPHWHPVAENLTVLSGTLLFAMGERVDEGSYHTHAPGDFMYLPAREAHYGGARGETVIQLHGTGPFAIELVNPAQ